MTAHTNGDTASTTSAPHKSKTGGGAAKHHKGRAQKHQQSTAPLVSLPSPAFEPTWYYAGRYDDVSNGPVTGACILQWIAQGKMTDEVRLKRYGESSFTALATLTEQNGGVSPFYETSVLDARQHMYEQGFVSPPNTTTSSTVVYANRTTAIVDTNQQNGGGSAQAASLCSSADDSVPGEVVDPAILTAILPNGYGGAAVSRDGHVLFDGAAALFDQLQGSKPRRECGTQTYELHIDATIASSFDFLQRPATADVSVGTDIPPITQATASQCVVDTKDTGCDAVQMRLSVRELLAALQPLLDAQGILLTQ